MLSKLLIQNFAIIESIEIDFESGLNILIGETGAGKSIIIDSLSILLGEKASTSFIREGAKKSIIEGNFILSIDNPVWDLLSKYEIDIFETFGDKNKFFNLIIRREISLTGNSRIFINDTPTQFIVLKEIGDKIIDFHGQFEHQSLLNVANHLDILDAFAGNLELLKQYKKEFFSLKHQIQKFSEFQKNLEIEKSKFEKKLSIFSEINSLNILENEDEILGNELKLLENSEAINSNLSELYEALSNESYSLNSILSLIKKKLDYLSKFESEFNEFNFEINQHIPFFNELESFSENYLGNLQYNPQRIEEINQRLFQLNQLKRKYGSLDEILELREKLSEIVDDNSNFDKKSEQIFEEIQQQYNICKLLAKEISEKRFSSKNVFETEITTLLLELGFNFIDFKIDLNTIQENEIQKLDINKLLMYETGIDKCEFLLSSNLGEKPKELARIASGGELSRILLSLKTLVASDKNLPILVFDEIDAGVSGKIAHKVGELMRKFSHTHQIICITHSPQVTAAGNCVISIEKIESKNRNISVSHKLNREEIITEIAKFLSGTSVTESAIVSAEALVKNYKN